MGLNKRLFSDKIFLKVPKRADASCRLKLAFNVTSGRHDGTVFPGDFNSDGICFVFNRSFL